MRVFGYKIFKRRFNFRRYKNTGWGLSRPAFEILHNLILNIGKAQINILEFGSGVSTRFLIDMKEYYNLDMYIDSFDDSGYYAFKDIRCKDFLNLMIRPLLECDTDDFNQMFKKREYDPSVMRLRIKSPEVAQLNCFYDIHKGDLKDHYDLMILDGPHGNGRSIAFLHTKKLMRSGSYIFIDDYTHYDFVDRLKSIFNCEEVYQHNDLNKKDKWRGGGDFVLYRILGEKT